MLTKRCSRCTEAYIVDDEDVAFYEKISPRISGNDYSIPTPALCPECRSKRRMVWRNERSLSVRACTRCKKQKVSMFSPESLFNTYCIECFNSDGWDAMHYGRDYDFSKSFFENMKDLMHETPLAMLYQVAPLENCEYTNYFGPSSRNCYLMYNSGRDGDCSYCRGLIESQSCLDMLIGSGNQYCYECVNASDCYGVSYSQNVAQCTDSAFLFNCRRCENCFGCTNLIEKENYLFNKQCTPGEVAEHMQKLQSASFMKSTRDRLERFKRECIHRENNNINTEACTGDYLTACKACIDCYESKGSEDCKRLLCSRLVKDSHDLFGYGYDSQLLYDCCGVGLSTMSAFSWICSSMSDAYYCLQCESCKHCFGCVSLKHKQYCILNKHYAKDEYEALVGQIITAMQASDEWGEFFPWAMAPFAYNHTVAQEFIPLSREDVESAGFRWSEVVVTPPQVTRVIAAHQLPDSVTETPDDVLNWAILCEATGKPFKLTKPELAFLRRMNLAIPRAHPDQRHTQRMHQRNPCRLWDRTCAKCLKGISTTYAPERPETVYCEACYLQAVY